MATRGTNIRYNSDYTSTKSAIDAALTKTGASYSWSNTVTSAGTLAKYTQLASLKAAVDAANARFCSNQTSCSNCSNCVDCGNNGPCPSNNASNRGNCPNYANRGNNGNRSSNNGNHSGDNGNNSDYGSWCSSVLRRQRCGGDANWHISGLTLFRPLVEQ